MSDRSRSAWGLVRNTIIVIALAAAALWGFSAWTANEAQKLEMQSFGAFSGQPITRWTDDGRDMVLVEEFSFTDPKGKIWTAPAEVPVNGASIPESFWSVIGSPFVGKYRDASVIHDYYCDVRTEPPLETHQTFYYAMRARGVPKDDAAIKYLAVKHFGPYWDENGVLTNRDPDPTTRSLEGVVQPASTSMHQPGKMVQDMTEADIAKMKAAVENMGEGLISLESLDTLEFE